MSALTALLALASGDTGRGVIAPQTPLRGAKTREENEIENINQSIDVTVLWLYKRFVAPLTGVPALCIVYPIVCQTAPARELVIPSG